MVISFKNTEIFYTVQGEGRPVILLHGFLESSDIWKNFISRLSPDRKIICIDLPGHGNSGCLGEVHTMDLLAEAVFTVAENLSLQNALLLGHSMGGYVCMAILEKYPALADGIILLNSTPARDSPEKKESRDRAITLAEKNKSAFVSMAINNLLPPDQHQKFQKELNELKSRALHFPVDGITAALRGMKVRPDRQNILKDFSYRKVIIAGKRDPVLDYNEMKNISTRCNTELISCNGGHLSYMEDPNELLNFVYFIE